MEKLAKQCFAYPQRQKYPVHTKQATLQSHKAYLRQSSQLSPAVRTAIQQRFNKAAAVHQIQLAAAQPYIAHRKVASLTCGNNTVRVAVPQNTKDMLQLALNIEDMADNKGHATKQLRQMAKIAMQWASQLQCQQSLMSSLFDMPVMQTLSKIAGMGIGQKDQICQQLLKRASYIEFDKDGRKFFADTYNSIKNMEKQHFIKSATLNTLCDTLQALDRRFDLQKYYGKQLSRPRQVCFSETVHQLCKKAADTVLIASTGTILSKKALLQRSQAAKQYFQRFFEQNIATDQQLIEKTANLGASYVNSFLEHIEK